MAIGIAVKRQLWDSTWGHCWYCGKQLIWPHPDDPDNRDRVDSWFVVEHIVSRSVGGTDDPGNLHPACWACNGSKGKRSIEEYRLYLSVQAAGIPYFKKEQVEWLQDQGFVFPKVELVKFWGERPYAPRS